MVSPNKLQGTVEQYELHEIIKKVHIKRNVSLTVARCMVIPGDFKVVRIKRDFVLHAFVYEV